jgi:hypothetical protein
MAAARPPFDGYRPVPLRVVAGLADGYLLCGTPELPQDHAWLVAQAMDHAGLGRPPSGASLPGHPGAQAFWSGAAMPG